MRKKKIFIPSISVLILLAAGCTMSKHRQCVRDNLLITGLNMMAFAKEWGVPDATFAVAGDQVNEWTARIGWRGMRFEPDPRPYDVWVYREKGYTLLFHGYALVAWGKEGMAEELEEERRKIPEASKSWKNSPN